MENQDEKDLENLKKLISDILKAKEAFRLSDKEVETAIDNILDNISKLMKKMKKNKPNNIPQK
mgnify:CR=1 FL=1